MDAKPPLSALSEPLQEAQHLQVIESNPLSETEIAMFAMFERENWPHERRRAHILAQFQKIASAAE